MCELVKNIAHDNQRRITQLLSVSWSSTPLQHTSFLAYLPSSDMEESGVDAPASEAMVDPKSSIELQSRSV